MDGRIKTFAERLNEAIEIKGIKKIELARKTGLSRPIITQYAKGKFDAKQDNLHKIALALNVNEAWLMGYDVPMQRAESINDKIEEINRVFAFLSPEQQEAVLAFLQSITNK